MSTTFTTPPHVIAAIRQLHADILPAKLDPNKTVENGTILVAWLNSKGIAMNDATASDWYNAVNAEAEKLHWSIKPAKLKARENLTSVPKKGVIKAEAEAFVEAEKENRKKAEQSLADS